MRQGRIYQVCPIPQNYPNQKFSILLDNIYGDWNVEIKIQRAADSKNPAS
jgi:hypothetical protein